MAIGIIFYLCVRPLSSQPIFIMVLRTGSDDWQELLTKIGISADSAKTYAKTFVEENITKDSLTMIDWEVLKELGVTTMGHALAILKLAKEQPLTSDSYIKAPAVKFPQIHSGMTSQQFRKFRNPEDIPGNQSTRLKIFPDSGASICLGGPKHLYCMGLNESNLIPSKKVIHAVGGSTLISWG